MPERRIVGWCPEHETWQPLEEGTCGAAVHEVTNGRLRRRRMYVCEHPYCRWAWPDGADCPECEVLDA